jgi:hypothetical protein
MDITGLGSAFKFAENIMDRIWPKQASEDDKLKAIASIAPLLEERDSAIEESTIDARKSIMLAEMQQGDVWTKRARPSVVYGGLAFIAVNHVIFPIIVTLCTIFADLKPEQLASLKELTNMELPTAFWASWTSICGIWSIGRTAERRGSSNRIISLITGNK